jgi:hypothetical protein
VWTRNPWRYALSLSFFGSLWIVLAFLGCKLRKSPWTFVACNWSDSPWWSEAGVGVAFLLISVYFWRKALQTLPPAA